MAQNLQSRLDAEVNERLDPFIEKYNSGKRVKVGDIFPTDVVAALGRSNVFLSGADAKRIMTSIPFYETVFVAICYECAATRDIESVLPLLQSGPVMPVLINSYREYPEEFLKEIVKFPHLGRKEFSFYRDTTIIAASANQICGHCADEKLKNVLKDPAAQSEIVKRWARELFSLLGPFVAPDFTLLDQFASAVQRRDLDQIKQLMQLGWTINSIRTAQAFRSAQAIPLDALLELPTLGNIDPLLHGVTIDELKMLAADELGLVVPTSVSIDRYLDIVLPFQKRLSGLVDKIVEEGGKRRYTEIVEIVQDINSELRKTEKSKRFLAYRAIAGFAAGNSMLIGGLLVSGALGVGGHLAGCGASLVTAVGSKVLKKWKPLRDNRALNRLGRSVRASLQPAVAKVLSAYLGISTRSVEVWQLRQEMLEEPVTMAVGSVGRNNGKAEKRKVVRAKLRRSAR